MASNSKAVVTRKQNRRRTCTWSDLPQEILELIKKQLLFAGQFSFRAVCKSWSSINSFPPQKQIPWLVVFEKNFMINRWRCKLVDPTPSKTYNIDMTAIREKEKIVDFNTVRVHESKYGWLLISSQYNQLRWRETSLFLFSPFYKEKNNLIELPDSPCGNNCFATFTSNPLEKDCLFLIVFTGRNGTVIYTCRRGDTSWRDSCIPVGIRSVGWRRWMYSEGILYYIDADYKMGTFNIARKKWSVIPPPPPTFELSSEPPPPAENIYIVKADGEEELLLVYAPDLRGYIGYIYRLDLSLMIWERVNSLGDDNVLFIGDGYKSVVLKLSEMKMMMMKRISVPVMVYYCGGSNLGCLSSTHMEDGSHQDDDSFDYGSMATKSCGRKIFIDPPPYHHYHH